MKRSILAVAASLLPALLSGAASAAELRGNITLSKTFQSIPLYETSGFWTLPNPVLAPRPTGIDPRMEIVVELVGSGLPDKELVRPVLRIKDAQFLPAVLPIKPKARLQVDNQDWMSHLIETKGLKAKRLGPGDALKHTFGAPGDYRVRCTEVPHLVAEVFVSEAPLVTLPESNGTFRFPAIPSGSYTLRMWYRGKKIHEEPVAVRGTTRVDIQLKKPAAKD